MIYRRISSRDGGSDGICGGDGDVNVGKYGDASGINHARISCHHTVQTTKEE